MAKPATTSAEVATKVRAFIDAGRPLPAGRGGRWSVVTLVRELGFAPAENYVQYLWKNKEVLDVLNAYAVEQGLAAVGTTPLGRRSNKGVPRSTSSLRICRFTADEATLRTSAARRMEPSRAT